MARQPERKMKFEISKDHGELVETDNDAVEVEPEVFAVDLTEEETNADSISIGPRLGQVSEVIL